MDIIKVRSRVPGSCGELIQGEIDGVDFLISCPINLYSTVTVNFTRDFSGIKLEDKYYKARAAARKILNYYQKNELGIEIKIESDLISGKGMGSSTADIAAVMGAIMFGLENKIDYNLIKKLILSIEPSDSTFLPGINIWDHREGKIQKKFNSFPEFDILMFVERGRIDTLKFNQKINLKNKNKDKEKIIKKALQQIKKGIKYEDKTLLGQGVTLSSKAHQRIIERSHLNLIIKKINQYRRTYGVNIAHSGKLLGILVEPDHFFADLIKEIEQIKEVFFYKKVKLVTGGIQIIKEK